ncbi:hypothetical protein V8E53_010064 [Lactarius tabidus]
MVPTLLTINIHQFSAANFKLATVLPLVERVANSHGSSTDLRCSARTAVATFTNVYARGPTQDSSTVAYFAHPFPCFRAIDSSAALRRSRGFPRAGAGGDLCSWAWRAVPRVEVQLGGSLLPKGIVDVVAHTRLGRRHPAAGLWRRWATRKARTPADTRNGFKVLVRARVVRLATCAYRTARTLHSAGEQTALGISSLKNKSSTPGHTAPTLEYSSKITASYTDRVTTNIITKAAALRSSTVLDVFGKCAPVIQVEAFIHAACQTALQDVPAHQSAISS